MRHIIKALQNKVLVLDGAMGTIIQSYKLQEKDFTAKELKDIPNSQLGNNDILSLSRPDIIREIHLKYLQAGANIIETNTFNANSISQKDYGTESWVYELNRQAAKLANEAISLREKQQKGSYFVAGSIGPTNKTASMSPDVERPEFRDVSFDDLVTSYATQIKGLLDGGVDLLLIETVFDTLNAKAALFAAETIFEELAIRLPIIVSATIVDKSGRLLSGQTLEAFITSVNRESVIGIGLNCSFGAKDLLPYLHKITSSLSKYLVFYPNAGLPNEVGEYSETPKETADFLRDIIVNSKVNIIGGCCGTTYNHIQEIAKLTKNIRPRKIPPQTIETSISGLENLVFTQERNFTNIGERTNVAGSKRFARLIKAKKYSEAISVARNQIEGGAQIIDICMDDAMLDSLEEMKTFLRYVATEPDISTVPIMIDSSKWEVLEEGLKCIQGKSIVNSISLKDGKEAFIQKAKLIKKYGAAVVVMAFDETGQAVSFEDKIAICKRSYRYLTEEVGFPPQDIIFDPNILAIATGIEEHAGYAAAYIKAVKWIKENLPHAKVSGGVSNLSFAFRGNNTIREAMHSAFLFHAVNAGMDMGIVNPEMLQIYEDIPKNLLNLIENVIFNKDKTSVDRLIDYSQKNRGQEKTKASAIADWRKNPPCERIIYALTKGITDYIDEDIEEIRPQFTLAFKIVDEVLMEGMKHVGELFGAGKMFLPQVVKSARVMKKAVSYLRPFIENELKSNDDKPAKKRKILLATVKGDVHDIGKNIVGLVLYCNNFEVIDLGVMVPCSDILRKAKDEKVDVIGLSGLITPSLEEMTFVASQMRENDVKIPLIVGGATTSKLHTSIKIAPCYEHGVVHVTDASKSVEVVKNLCEKSQKNGYLSKVKDEYQRLSDIYYNKKAKTYVSLKEARKNRLTIDWDESQICKPNFTGTKTFMDYSLSEIAEYIDWRFFFTSWGLKGTYPKILTDEKYKDEALKLFKNGKALLNEIIEKRLFTAKALINISPANAVGDDIVVYDDKGDKRLTYHTLRQQEQGSSNLSLADFLCPREKMLKDYLGSFVTGIFRAESLAKKYHHKNDDFSAIMCRILADRLAEAFAELMHKKVRTQYWQYTDDKRLSLDDLFRERYQGIRPAFGYPSLPDQTEIVTFFTNFNITEKLGIKLTEHFMMYPTASVCGLYFAHPASRYFYINKIDTEQATDFAKRKGVPLQKIEKYLSKNLK